MSVSSSSTKSIFYFKEETAEENIILNCREEIREGLIKGISAIQHAGIVHSDFKPENIWIDENRKNPHITDFNLSFRMGIIPRDRPFRYFPLLYSRNCITLNPCMHKFITDYVDLLRGVL